ncbi:MAG: hypothetical protein RLZZ532_2594 [Cyanobacteriota bacterium]
MISGIVTDRHATITLTFLLFNGSTIPIEFVIFIERIDSLGRSSVMPYLPITLSNGSNSVEVMALLDTGASVNVLPYQISLQLGAICEQQTVPNPREK